MKTLPNKISGLVQTRKAIDFGGQKRWFAMWRGTSNRVRRANGELVLSYRLRSELIFDLLNNPMENGVISYKGHLTNTNF